MHRARLVLLLLLVGALLGASGAGSASSGMVVSQVYAGGGNSGATFANDFVELFKPRHHLDRPRVVVDPVRVCLD